MYTTSLLEVARARLGWWRPGGAIDLREPPDLDTAAVWDELIASIDKEACQKLTIRTKMAALPERWPA